mmetsp:Transcript_27474/g.20632  ORF Transcript_27474/g.20632 Transcript_27474/m.20632 type:complete len:87 (+) Transcript_27474:82-342(+)
MLKKARSFKQSRDARKFNFEPVDANLTQRVLASDVSQLHEMLLRNEVSSYDLVNIFGKRCYEHGRRLNLVTEEYYELALQEARLKD